MSPLGDKTPMTIVDVKGILTSLETLVQNHDGASVNDEVDGSHAPEIVDDAGGEVAKDDEKVFASERYVVCSFQRHVD